MSQTQNPTQPVGFALPGWTPRPRPDGGTLTGRFCRVEPLDASRHGDDLFEAFSADDGRMWTYMPYGPFADRADYAAWLAQHAPSRDPLFHAIVDATSGEALGVASYLRIDPANGCIEVGHIALSPRLQRTAAATEAMYLMMRQAFELGYRRYEWKCDALNAPSRAAAARLGFSFEGIFRQAVVVKGRNRDTAWFSVIDKEWPTLAAAFEAWLAPDNFDAEGRQKRSLASLRQAG